MRLLLLLALFVLGGCQSLAPLPQWQSPQGRDHPDLGLILDLHSGRSLTPRQLINRLAGAERVLLGERHDNPDHHALQVWLLQRLSERRGQGSLLLEMLTPGQQAAVDRARAQWAHGVKPTDLPVLLDWQQGWDWALYGPLVSYALAQPWPLLAANLEQDEIRDIYARPPRLSGSKSTAAPVRQALLRQIRTSHCGLLPESQLPAMLAVQQQRDRRMAESLLAAPRPSLLLAGAFHVRRDLGVPLHLADLGASEGTHVLILAEVGEAVTAQQADFVWYTPAQATQNHCASLRRAGG